MKSLKDIVIERLVLSKDKNTSEYTLFPKTKEELETIINSEINKNGVNCSLNHIDVSKITDMGDLFIDSKFNGDISKWDVSNVTNMGGMFYNSKFNGDISAWDVSSVTNMSCMFYHCSFSGENGDISVWDVSNVRSMSYMFNYNFNFDCDLSAWDVSNVIHMDNIFEKCPLENKPPKWYKK